MNAVTEQRLRVAIAFTNLAGAVLHTALEEAEKLGKNGQIDDALWALHQAQTFASVCNAIADEKMQGIVVEESERN